VAGPRERLRRVRLWPAWPNQYPVRIDLRGDDVPRDIPTEQLTERFGVPADIVAEIDEWDRETAYLMRWSLARRSVCGSRTGDLPRPRSAARDHVPDRAQAAYPG
jgi:hypothetical protein